MTEVWGVVGPEGVFEQAPSVIHAEAWERYGGTLQWPISGKKAVKRDGVVTIVGEEN